VGANFLFGRDRSGNFSMLRSLGARYGFRAEKIDPVRYKDFVVSSTRVRRLIAEGRVDEAGALLGHHYYVDGSVIQGQRRGRQLGFPTANLCSDNELMPPAGVYATVAQIDGIYYPSVTNVGVRPTFEEANTGRGQVTVEAHLFDFGQDLYGRRLRLEFVQRLRDERRFESVDALKAQIGIDCAQTRALFDSMSL
jgi:riboflavin kinase/FMN adenylyltransferase